MLAFKIFSVIYIIYLKCQIFQLDTTKTLECWYKLNEAEKLKKNKQLFTFPNVLVSKEFVSRKTLPLVHQLILKSLYMNI